MRIKTIFVAYPYTFGVEYRLSLERRFAGSGIEFRYADDNLANCHVMDKIQRMMSEADVCFFDVSGNNPNVFFELGYALGAEEPGFVVVCNDAVDALSADIIGWDSLRYASFDDLAEQVFDRVSKGRVPVRRREGARIDIPVRPVQQVLGELRFGVPASDHARLVVFVVPELYDRFYTPRSVLGTPPYRAQDVCPSVLQGPNETHYNTYFWPQGFSYSPRPGPDFVEVYPGLQDDRPSDRSTNFRVYLSGVVTYMQRLRRRGPDNSPFLYLYMYQEIVEMALIAIMDVRKRWNLSEQGQLSVGTVFLDAADLRISDATQAFYAADDVGRSFAAPQDVEWIPAEPRSVPSDGLNPKELANEFLSELAVRLD